MILKLRIVYQDYSTHLHNHIRFSGTIPFIFPIECYVRLAIFNQDSLKLYSYEHCYIYGKIETYKWTYINMYENWTLHHFWNMHVKSEPYEYWHIHVEAQAFLCKLVFTYEYSHINVNNYINKKHKCERHIYVNIYTYMLK